MKGAPVFWMCGNSAIKSAVNAYIVGRPMTPDDIATMRAYLKQWVAGDWRDDDTGTLQQLRLDVDKIADRIAIEDWLYEAVKLDVDPL